MANSKVQADPKASAVKIYCDAKAAGKSNQEALDAAKAAAGEVGIGHSICDLNWYADPRNPAVVKPIPGGVPVAQHGDAAVALRGGAGWVGHYEGVPLSWGKITIALGLFTYGDLKSPEGKVSTLSSQASGLAREGQRIGRGGRHLSNDPALYVGNHKSIGVEDPKPRSVDREALKAGADTYTSKVKAIAAKKAAAAKRVKKATAKKQA
jgi:hypothetical protein